MLIDPQEQPNTDTTSYFFPIYNASWDHFYQTCLTAQSLIRVGSSLISWNTASFGKVALATVFIGYCASLGSVAIAAFNLASVTVYMLSLPTVLLQACETIINQNSRNPDKVALNFKRGLMLVLLTGLACMALLYFVPTPLFTLMGQDPAIINMIQTYCSYYALSIIPSSIVDLQISVINAANSRDILFPMSLISFSIWAITAYVLMNTAGLGLAGLAIASIVDSVLTASLLGIYLSVSSRFRDYPLMSQFSRSMFDVSDIVIHSWPFSYDYITRALMMFARKACLAIIGVNALVIEQIAFQWLGFSDLLTEGINQAATVKIAQQTEEGDIAQRHMTGNANLLLSFVICSLFILPLVIIPKVIASIYLDQGDLDALSDSMNLFYCFAFVSVYKLLLKLNYGAVSNCLGILDTNLPNVINGISSAGITTILSLSLMGYLSMNFYGIFGLFIFATLLSSSLIYGRWELQNTEPGSDDVSMFAKVFNFFIPNEYASDDTDVLLKESLVPVT